MNQKRDVTSTDEPERGCSTKIWTRKRMFNCVILTRDRNFWWSIEANLWCKILIYDLLYDLNQWSVIWSESVISHVIWIYELSWYESMICHMIWIYELLYNLNLWCRLEMVGLFSFVYNITLILRLIQNESVEYLEVMFAFYVVYTVINLTLQCPEELLEWFSVSKMCIEFPFEVLYSVWF